MPEFTSYEPGTPSWVDHGAKNIDASNSFYADLFGWEPEDQGEEAGHYTILRRSGKAAAGNMGIMSEGQPCVWTTYVSVEDADKTVEVAQDAGATVFAAPMDVMDIGRMSVFADPTGAAVGIWQPKTFSGAEVANEPGAFCWNELNTRDLAASKAFYTRVFGWTANDLDADGMQYTEWKVGDKAVAGMMAMPDMVPAEVPAHWLVYFGTEDTDATVAKATKLGGSAIVPPTDIPPGRFSVLMDPDGATFAVIKMSPPEF
jgi:predicted enzyme related to lactoylglutathione lyase